MGSIGSPCSYWKEHRSCSRGAHIQRGQQAFRSSPWSARFTHQTLRPLQGKEIRACPWSSFILRIQEIRISHFLSMELVLTMDMLIHFLLPFRKKEKEREKQIRKKVNKKEKREK